MEFVDGTLAGACRVKKLTGPGFAIVDMGRNGEGKAYHGDHVLEVETTREAIYGEKEFDLEKAKADPPEAQKMVTRICRFVLSEDAARATGVFQEDVVEPPSEAIDATGATAGNPGSFTPSGATPPVDLASMVGIVATPASGWLVGEHVVLGDASHASWDGGAWVAGDGVGIAAFSTASKAKKSGVVQDTF